MDYNNKKNNGPTILQSNVFLRWISNIINNTAYFRDEDCYTDLSNGVILVQLAIALTRARKRIYYEHVPKNKNEKIKNINLALEIFKNDGFSLQSITKESIINNDQKILLSLIWKLILHYSIKQAKNHADLLKWASKIIKAYPSIKNFSSYWLSMCALLDYYYPSKINFNSLNKNNTKENSELATKVMKELGIPIFINLDESLQYKIDNKSLLTQLSAVRNVLENSTKSDNGQIERKKQSLFLVQSECLSFSFVEVHEPIINHQKKYKEQIFKLSLELTKAKAEIASQKEEISALNREADIFANMLNDKLKELDELSKSFKVEEKNSKKYIAEIDDIDEDEELLAKQLIETQEENTVLNREVDLFANTLSEKLEENSAVNREATIFALTLSDSLKKNEALNREADIFANKLSDTLNENKSLKNQVSYLNREADLLAITLSEKIDENEAVNIKTDSFVESLASEIQENTVLNREADLFAYSLSNKINEIKLLNNKIQKISFDLENEIKENKSLNEESVFIANKLNQKVIENAHLKKDLQRSHF